MSIYNPKVLAYAREHGITDLQAYRALKSREELQRRAVKLFASSPYGKIGKRSLFERITGVSPDWNFSNQDLTGKRPPLKSRLAIVPHQMKES